MLSLKMVSDIFENATLLQIKKNRDKEKNSNKTQITNDNTIILERRPNSLLLNYVG